MKEMEFTVESARLRASILKNIRLFFENRNVLEVETPLLSRGISTDCHLDVFSTMYHPDGFSPSEKSTLLFLQTSPELLMKRLLSAGFPDMFQICRVFRNGEYGRIHNPEFTMLEWYRRKFSMNDFMKEVYDLCISVLGEKECRYVTYEEAFYSSTKVNPLESSYDDLHSFCRSQGSDPQHCSSKSDLLNYIMSEYVEPKMDQEALIFVHNFPTEQAVFAKIDPDDKRTALRFELYYKGVELCNGWEELAGLESEEIKRRMERENKFRSQAGKPLLPVDPNFISSVSTLPPCSGAALGLDRLIMLAKSASSVKEVISFSFGDC